VLGFAFFPAPPMLESLSDSVDRLPDAFRLTKRKGLRTIIATCAAYSNSVGWDLELSVEGEAIIESGPMRSADQMMRTIDEWKSAMLQSGWSCYARKGSESHDAQLR
jgi:hypothetical protein